MFWASVCADPLTESQKSQRRSERAFSMHWIARNVSAKRATPNEAFAPTSSSATARPRPPTHASRLPPSQPAEIASAYVYLASGESSFTSGSTLSVTGGSPTP